MQRIIVLAAVVFCASCSGGGDSPAADDPLIAEIPPADCGPGGCSSTAKMFLGESGTESCSFKPTTTVAEVGGCAGLLNDGTFAAGFQRDIAILTLTHASTSGMATYLHFPTGNGRNHDGVTSGTWSGAADTAGLIDAALHLTGGARAHADPGGRIRVRFLPQTPERLPVFLRSGSFLSKPETGSMAPNTATRVSVGTHNDISVAIGACARDGTTRPILESGRMLEVTLQAGCSFPAMTGLLGILPDARSNAVLFLRSAGPEVHWLDLTRE